MKQAGAKRTEKVERSISLKRGESANGRAYKKPFRPWERGHSCPLSFFASVARCYLTSVRFAPDEADKNVRAPRMAETLSLPLLLRFRVF